jgi:hypothetical protein
MINLIFEQMLNKFSVMKKILILISAGLIFYSCSASTDSRYEREKEKPEEKKDVTAEVKQPVTEIVENFDFTPYRTKLDIPERKITVPVSIPESEIWYEYDEIGADTSSLLSKKIIDKAQGYRVLVLITDNLEEANNMKSEIYSNNSQREVYVIFDPPFYKVMVGDFLEYSEAKDLSFKMNQLGYTDARVVNETVNIFE